MEMKSRSSTKRPVYSSFFLCFFGDFVFPVPLHHNKLRKITFRFTIILVTSTASQDWRRGPPSSSPIGFFPFLSSLRDDDDLHYERTGTRKGKSFYIIHTFTYLPVRAVVPHGLGSCFWPAQLSRHAKQNVAG